MMKGIFITLLSICAFKTAFPQAEQTLNKVVIAPPTAASLIKYADIPVNYHTGIPQIGLPIYSLKEGSLELPISLSYHAGGIKLDEQASWVGLAWSLNAGGVITRTVMGTPDEQTTSEFSTNEKGHLSNNGYNNYYFKPDGFSPIATHDVAFITDIAGGIIDGEPDLFFFNFNGYSGKFYFNDDGRPVVVPESDLKIDYTYTGAGSVKQFVITTSDGVKYYFGCTDNTGDTDPVEMTHNFYTGDDLIFYTGTNNTIASWYLSKIVSADNQFSITLNYTPEEYSYKTVVGRPLNNTTYTGTTNLAKYYGHWVQGVRLTSITTSSSNVTVYFDAGPAREDLSDYMSASSLNDAPNTSAKSLGAIRILTSLNDCRKFTFSYSYFTSDVAGLPAPSFAGTSTADLKRLKLNQVKEEKCDGTQSLPPYVFDYFTDALPRRLSFAKDHWGFINGKTTNDRLIPTFYEKIGTSGVFNEKIGADRDSYWPAMRASTLKKITNPTGGFTEFDFEANTTYLSYTKYDKVLSFSMYAAIYGQANPNIQMRTFNNAGYTVKLTNWPIGGGASLSGIPGLYVSASGGQTVYNQGAVTAGTYQLTLSKPGAFGSNNGVSADVYEWIPSSIQENRIVGGLRIKSVTHSDGLAASPNIVTNYEYNLPNTQSSGHLYSRPTYVQIVRNDFMRDAGTYACCTSSAAHCSPFGYEMCSGDAYLISPNSLRPMQTTQGNHLGYNEVKVFQTGNGYKIYRYYGSNAWDNNYSDVADRVVELGLPQSNDLPSFPSAPPKTDFMRGELKYEAAFNQSNELLTESLYFPEYTENPLKTPAIVMASGVAMLGFPAFYEMSTSKKTKTTIQTNFLQPGTGYLNTTTENFFGSAQHTQLSKNIEISSKAETIESNYKYAADYKPAGCVTISDGLSAYNTACTTCLTQFGQDRALPSHNTPYWGYWDYQKLLKCRSEARKTFVTARKNYFNPSLPGSFAHCMATAKTNASTDLKPLFELQDKFINAPVETYTKRNTKYVDATFSKYNYATAPVGMIYPVAIQKMNVATPPTTFTIAAISGNNLVKDSRYADEATIVMNNGNVAQATAKNDNPTSYIWAYNNTLPIVKAQNVDYVTLQNAYTAVGGNLSQLRSHATLSNALINTYEYRPGVGIIKETDVNGRNIFYEYDAFNRLRIIKDHDNNVVRKICYNYAGQPDVCDATIFTNAIQSGNFTRNNCGAGYIGSTVTYTVAAGAYTSSTSQANADAQAVADVSANGQNHANTNGTCTQLITVNGHNTKSTSYSVRFTNNATEAQYTFNLNPNTFSFYTLGTVPAGIYKVEFIPAGSPLFATHNINGSTYYGQYGATFYNISITATSSASMY